MTAAMTQVPPHGYDEIAQDDRECACYYYFDEKRHNDIVSTRNYVYSGRAVRPVCDKK